MFGQISQTSSQDLPVREPQRVFTITGPTGFFSDHSNFAFLDRPEFAEQCSSLADVVAAADESVVAHYGEMPRALHAWTP